MKIFKYLLLIISIITLCGCEEDTPIYENQSDEFMVEVKGQVKFPGIYVFNQKLYMYELIKTVGGLLENADENKINYSELIDKSCVIVIPEKTTQVDSQDTLININYASLEQLMMLPKIGEALAQRIITYRETNGLFKTKEEIMNVSGIKENIFNQIKDKITV